MLVLSRKVQQKIVIGKHVTVTVTRILGGQVRIGIEAPPDFRIRRGELVPKEGEEPKQCSSE